MPASYASKKNAPQTVEVMFNPSELSIDQSVAYAEHPVLGSIDRVIQFVRAEGRTMSVELFLDGTNANRSVEDDLAGPLATIREGSQYGLPRTQPPVAVM